MTSDPNWFYSTLAQSTAAIVGLAGGVLATRLVAHRGDVAGERELPLRLFADLTEEVAMVSRSTAGFIDGVDRVVADVERRDAIGQDRTIALTPILTTLRAEKRAFPSPGTVSATNEHIRALSAARSQAMDLREEVAALNTKELARRLLRSDPLTPSQHSWLANTDASPRDPNDYWEELEQQGEVAALLWSVIGQRYETTAAQVRIYRSRLVPRSTITLVVVLGLSLLVGTVAPMASLTARAGAGKDVLLVSFTVLAPAVVVILGYEVWRIRQAADLSRDTF